jgi:2-amino-1-hydroxyethylphosphonate dioxygenase (glycine-forming)
MSAAEAVEFEQNPDADLIIRMRYWDDAAKFQNMPVTNIAYLKEIAIKHLSGNL